MRELWEPFVFRAPDEQMARPKVPFTTKKKTKEPRKNKAKPDASQ